MQVASYVTIANYIGDVIKTLVASVVPFDGYLLALSTNSGLDEDNISDTSDTSNNSTYIQLYGESDSVSSSILCYLQSDWLYM